MDLRKHLHNQADISLLLAKHVISTRAKDSNLVFSPLSIHAVLGSTRDQILGFLEVRSTQRLNLLSSQIVTRLFADGGSLGGPLLSLADGVWVDHSVRLKPAFEEIVEKD